MCLLIETEPLGFEQALLGESREVTREPLAKGTRVRGVEGFAARSRVRWPLLMECLLAG